MIEKIEISMMNETVHNFRKGEFGVQNIEIHENRGFIEIEYNVQEGGEKRVLIPLQNVEKCEFTVKNVDENKDKQNTNHPNSKDSPEKIRLNPKNIQNRKHPISKKKP